MLFFMLSHRHRQYKANICETALNAAMPSFFTHFISEPDSYQNLTRIRT